MADTLSYRVTLSRNTEYESPSFEEQLCDEVGEALASRGLNAEKLPRPQLGGGLSLSILLAVTRFIMGRISAILDAAAIKAVDAYSPTFKVFLTRTPVEGDQYKGSREPGYYAAQLRSIGWQVIEELAFSHKGLMFQLQVKVGYNTYNYELDVELTKLSLTKGYLGKAIGLVKRVKLKYEVSEKVRYSGSPFVEHVAMLGNEEHRVIETKRLRYLKFDSISNLRKRDRGLEQVEVKKGMVRMVPVTRGVIK